MGFSVPRARGDEPLSSRQRTRILLVFPAPAGMNRRPWRHPRRVRRVPRARGDEPIAKILETVDTEVFPAPAGMNRGFGMW